MSAIKCGYCKEILAPTFEERENLIFLGNAVQLLVSCTECGWLNVIEFSNPRVVGYEKEEK